MLVLTRKLQQQIKIGDNIVLTILKVKGQTVRVGIEAPREVHVVRSELPPNDTNDSGSDGDNGSIASDRKQAGPIVAEFNLVLGDDSTDDAADDSAASAEAGSKSPKSEVARPRLPQRKTYNRFANPPIKVASPSLAIAK